YKMRRSRRRAPPQGGNESSNSKMEDTRQIHDIEDDRVGKDLEQYQKTGLEDLKCRLRMYKDEKQSELLTRLVQLEDDDRRYRESMRERLSERVQEMNTFRTTFQDGRFRNKVPENVVIQWLATKENVTVGVTAATTIKELCLVAATCFGIPETEKIFLSDRNDGILHTSMNVMSLFWAEYGDPITPILTLRAPSIEDKLDTMENKWSQQMQKITSEHKKKWSGFKEKVNHDNIVRFDDVPWPHWITNDYNELLDLSEARDLHRLPHVAELTNHILGSLWSEPLQDKQTKYLKLIDTWRLDDFMRYYGDTMCTNDVIYVRCRLSRMVTDIQTAWDFVAGLEV
ncbi:uncharacterized protein LOC144356197, partial [Saccoglossus kowalevskii]